MARSKSAPVQNRGNHRTGSNARTVVIVNRKQFIPESPQAVVAQQIATPPPSTPPRQVIPRVRPLEPARPALVLTNDDISPARPQMAIYAFTFAEINPRSPVFAAPQSSDVSRTGFNRPLRLNSPDSRATAMSDTYERTDTPLPNEGYFRVIDDSDERSNSL